ncbi:hypothetical protein BJ970_006930 [Saccharopolyspora phatthalungensis]|uniref:Uncharacterized protein n=1 Tax=Saccharopolyspora phatthalungensis TaxID=664693 RepID=A0A840QGV3_9PSEU|nr:hypothetical protein [Saccharopolyspora phatthalungensis]
MIASTRNRMHAASEFRYPLRRPLGKTTPKPRDPTVTITAGEAHTTERLLLGKQFQPRDGGLIVLAGLG